MFEIKSKISVSVNSKHTYLIAMIVIKQNTQAHTFGQYTYLNTAHSGSQCASTTTQKRKRETRIHTHTHTVAKSRRTKGKK